MQLNSILVGGLAAVLIAAPACGAESRSASAAASIDACTLLAASEIHKELGLPVDAGVRRDAGPQSNGAYSSACIWTINPAQAVAADPTKPFGGKSFVILNVQNWPAGSGLAHTFLDGFREAAKTGEIPSQPEARKYGDEALSWGDGLAVRRRDLSFGVSVFVPGMTKERRATLQEKLAPHILRRLDGRA